MDEMESRPPDAAQPRARRARTKAAGVSTSPPSPPPSPPPPPPSRFRLLARIIGPWLWWIVAALFGAIVSLLVLLAVNGTLQFADRQATLTAQTEISQARQEQVTLRDQIAGIAERLTELQKHAQELSQMRQELGLVQGRVSAFSDETAQLTRDLDALRSQADGLRTRIETIDANLQEAEAQLKVQLREVNQRVDEEGDRVDQAIARVTQESETLRANLAQVEDDLSTLDAQVEAVRKAAERSDRFLVGVRELALSVSPPPAAEPISATLEPLPPTPIPTTAAPAAPPTTAGEAIGAPRPLPTPVCVPCMVSTPVGRGDQLAGLVWLDANQDGAMQVGETPLAGVEVVIANRLGQTRTLRTDAEGSFAVSPMARGTYTITLRAPDAFSPTTPTRVRMTLPEDGDKRAEFGVVPKP